MKRGLPTIHSASPVGFGTPPSGGAAQRGVRAARGWFDRTLAEADAARNLSASAACRLLCGFWLGSRIDREAPGQRYLRSRARTVVDAVIRSGRTTVPGEWVAVPLNLRLVASAVLEESGVQHPALNGPSGCLAQVRTACEQSRGRSDKASASAQLARLLVLQRIEPATLRLPWPILQKEADALSLGAAAADVNRLAALADAHTAQGCLPAPDPREARPLARLVTGFALAALRSYDFVRGCQLLRSAQRLDQGRSLVGAGLAFLLFHQRPDGAFGFFGAEELALEARARDQGRPLSTVLELTLPVTVECVWTLLEGCTGFRLIPSLRAVAHGQPNRGEAGGGRSDGRASSNES